MAKIKINWQVSDGYAGPSRPHSTALDTDELADCETWEEAARYISDSIQDHFEQIITFSHDPEDLKVEWETLRTKSEQEMNDD